MKIVFLIENINGYHYSRLSAFRSATKAVGYQLFILEIFNSSELYNHTDSHDRNTWDALDCLTSLKLSSDDAKRISTSAKLLDTLRKIDPHVVISLGFHQSYFILARIISLFVMRRTKWIFCSDSKQDDGHRNKIKEYIKFSFLPLFAGAFVAGSKHRDYWISLGLPSEDVIIGYDVVENRAFSPPSVRESRSPRSILCVSRLVERKGIDILLRAFAQCDVGSDWVINIVGDGPLRSDLQNLSDKLGIKNRVRFLGSVSTSEMPDIYRTAEFLVLASRWDQWGLCVNEAFASGIPAIVTDRCGCANEVVQNNLNGLVVPADSVVHLSSAIDLLCNSPTVLTSFSKNAVNSIKSWSCETFATSLVYLCQKATR